MTLTLGTLRTRFTMSWSCWMSLELTVMSRTMMSWPEDDVYGADIAARLADGRGYPGQHAYLVGVLGPDGDAVGYSRVPCC